MTVTIAFEDSKYLEALYGGRSITQSIAAQVAEVNARLAASDPFATPEAGFSYNAQTGELRVERDDREVEVHDILAPVSGYWSPAGFKVRNTGTLVAIIFNRRAGDNGLSAEGMFDWPIYRAALGFRANTAYAQSVTDIWNANLVVVVQDDEDRIAADAREAGVWPCGHADGLQYSRCPICSVDDPRDADPRDDYNAYDRYGSPEHEAWLVQQERNEA